MIKKIFKNKMTQEDKKTIIKMKSGKYIKMNYDKKNTPQTPDGLWFITINPNCNIDEVKLENDFYFILKLYYHWRFGNGWHKKKNKDKQLSFNGVIEKQEGNYHIHLITYCYNMEEISLFWSYVKKLFKQIYPKSSSRCSKVWDIKKVDGYINPFENNKGKTAESIILLN